MELALPRFTMAEGPRQVHLPWLVTSESPASPAQIEPRGERTPTVRWTRHRLRRCTSIWTHLHLHRTRSHWIDVKKCEDFAVTIVCHSEEADTHVKSEEVLSDEDFPAVFGAKEPSAPAVDLVTGKVSRTVSTSPLTLDSGS